MAHAICEVAPDSSDAMLALFRDAAVPAEEQLAAATDAYEAALTAQPPRYQLAAAAATLATRCMVELPDEPLEQAVRWNALARQADVNYHLAALGLEPFNLLG